MADFKLLKPTEGEWRVRLFAADVSRYLFCVSLFSFVCGIGKLQMGQNVQSAAFFAVALMAIVAAPHWLDLVYFLLAMVGTRAIIGLFLYVARLEMLLVAATAVAGFVLLKRLQGKGKLRNWTDQPIPSGVTTLEFALDTGVIALLVLVFIKWYKF